LIKLSALTVTLFSFLLPQDNFEIKCHHSTSVNDIKFHPKHGTMATAGSDGAFSFWDKEKRKTMKTQQMQQPVTSCCFNHDGQIFASSVGYDWAKGVGLNNSEQKKSHIFLHPCMEVTYYGFTINLLYNITTYYFYKYFVQIGNETTLKKQRSIQVYSGDPFKNL